MTRADQIKNICTLAALIAVSCGGSVALTVLMTNLPVLQSSANGNAGDAFGSAAAASSVVVLFYIARTFHHQGEESRMQRQLLEAQRLELAMQREVAVEQHRSAQQAAAAALRRQHQSLLQMAIGDPLLMECWPGYGPRVTGSRRRQYMYSNLVISHHAMCFDLGYYTDDEIEEALYHTFSSAVTKEFWQETRSRRNGSTPYGGSMRKFYELAEAAYTRRMSDR
ncbi:DUF6082 family protein [Streptomyces longisporoflavus]|uniref:DUF6082 family protein n=1 Tax=Streptomyces longisporoflavus TaxID=28044 RepID=UPI00167E0534|nr:DUF6082 family protein [Streptomyces longisporoflavus]